MKEEEKTRKTKECDAQMRPGTCIKVFQSIFILLSQTVTILRNHDVLFVKPVCSLLRDARKHKPRTVKPNADHGDLLERS